jgi:hypothetical protein
VTEKLLEKASWLVHNQVSCSMLDTLLKIFYYPPNLGDFEYSLS